MFLLGGALCDGRAAARGVWQDAPAGVEVS